MALLLIIKLEVNLIILPYEVNLSYILKTYANNESHILKVGNPHNKNLSMPTKIIKYIFKILLYIAF